MISASQEFTAERLLGYEVRGKRLELIRGQLVMREPAGVRHGDIGLRLAHRLLTHLERERDSGVVSQLRGTVHGPDTGFVLERGPDTVRAPDVSFVLAGRLPDPLPDGFGDLAPDLVVEVRSPRDRPGALLAKVGEYLTAGTQLAWVIDPEHASVTIYRSDGTVATAGTNDTVSGEALLPGFAVSVRDLLSAG
jgi:Uma2 family endonuclease